VKKKRDLILKVDRRCRKNISRRADEIASTG